MLRDIISCPSLRIPLSEGEFGLRLNWISRGDWGLGVGRRRGANDFSVRGLSYRRDLLQGVNLQRQPSLEVLKGSLHFIVILIMVPYLRNLAENDLKLTAAHRSGWAALIAGIDAFLRGFRYRSSLVGHLCL